VTEAERAALAAAADVLIPPAHGMPAASEAGVPSRGVDRVLAARPDLGPALAELLARIDLVSAAEDVRRLRASEPDAFRTLLDIVTAAYYLSPKVRRRLGYPGQRPHEVFLDQAEHDLRDGILDPVLARGPIWRDPSGRS
jgi:hypothetical protein